jgi:hypothetical protein
LSVSLDGEGAGDSTDQVADAVASTDVNDAASSPAEGVKSAADGEQSEVFDPLAVTRKALDPEGKAPADGEGAAPGSDAKEGEKPEGDKPAAEADPSKSEDEQDANLPFGKHPAWKRVISQRNEARQQVEELAPDATAYRQVRDFMSQSRLEPAEVQTGFAIMAALKNDPEKAHALLKPYVEKLEAVIGLKLPDDLRQKVEDGALDEASAQEIARGRGREVVRQERDAHAEQAARETQEQQAARARAEAADAYIASLAGKDPDFAAIEPLLEGQIQVAIRRRVSAGQPILTPAHVQEVCADAVKAIKTHLKGLSRPSGNGAVRSPPSSMSTSSPAIAPAPKTPLDVTRMALAGG